MISIILEIFDSSPSPLFHHCLSSRVIPTSSMTAAMWLFPLVMKKQATSSLSSKIALKARTSYNLQRKGTLTAYCKAGKYLMQTYCTDYLVMKIDGPTMKIPDQLNRTIFKYTKLLCPKVLDCDRGYSEYVIQENFIEGLQNLICESMCSFWSSNNNGTTQGRRLTPHP